MAGDKFASLIGSERPEATNIVIFGASGDLALGQLGVITYIGSIEISRKSKMERSSTQCLFRSRQTME